MCQAGEMVVVVLPPPQHDEGISETGEVKAAAHFVSSIAPASCHQSCPSPPALLPPQRPQMPKYGPRP